MCTPTEPQSLSSFHPIAIMFSFSAPNHCQLPKFKSSFYCQSAVIHPKLLRTTFTASYVFADYHYILLLPLLCLIPLDHERDPLQGDVNPSGDLLLELAQSCPVQEPSYRFHPILFLSGWVVSLLRAHSTSPATGKPWRWRRISGSFFSFCRGGYSIYWDVAWL